MADGGQFGIINLGRSGGEMRTAKCLRSTYCKCCGN